MLKQVLYNAATVLQSVNHDLNSQIILHDCIYYKVPQILVFYVKITALLLAKTICRNFCKGTNMMMLCSEL